MDIAEALKERGYEIDRRRITLRDAIKETGEFTVPVRLHRDVTVEIPVEVAAEGGAKPEAATAGAGRGTGRGSARPRRKRRLRRLPKKAGSKAGTANSGRAGAAAA